MKTSRFIVLVFIFSLGSRTDVYGQLQLGLQKIRDAFLRVERKVSTVAQSDFVKKTYDSYKLINDTKNLIGTMSATLSDMNQVRKRFIDDLKGAKGFSELQVKNLKDYFDLREDWNRGMQNSNGSIFNLADWYEQETRNLRDESGELNLLTTLINQTDNTKLQATIRAQVQFRTQLATFMVNDNEFQARVFFREARRKERMANLLTIWLNTVVFVKEGKNVADGFGSLFEGNASLVSKSDFLNLKDKSGFLSDFEISELSKTIEQYVSEANEARSKGFTMLTENQRIINSDPVLRAKHRVMQYKIQQEELAKLSVQNTAGRLRSKLN